MSTESPGIIAGRVIGHILAWAFAVWLAMLLIGAAHSTDARIPDLGFATTAILGAALSALGVATGKAARS